MLVTAVYEGTVDNQEFEFIKAKAHIIRDIESSMNMDTKNPQLL